MLCRRFLILSATQFLLAVTATPGVIWLLMDDLTALSYCYIGLVIGPLKLLCHSQSLVVPLVFFLHL